MNSSPTGDTPSPPCRLCGDPRTRCVGPILHRKPTLVAGVEIDLGATRYELRHCDACSFMFKHPGIPSDRLLACYEKADVGNWVVVDPVARRFDRIKHALESHVSGGRVLDVGCFTGDFLLYLGAGWTPLGVEPSTAAANQATAKGVRIVGPTIDDLSQTKADGTRTVREQTSDFDALVCLDVLEHLTRPAEFLRNAAALLRPGGIFLCVTADTDTLSWRLEKNLHWYCSLPEHVAFYNHLSLANFAPQAGMRSVAHQRMSHNLVSPRQAASEWTKNIGYVVMNALGGFGVPALQHWFVDRHAPIWTAVADHMIHMMKKNPA